MHVTACMTHFIGASYDLTYLWLFAEIFLLKRSVRPRTRLGIVRCVRVCSLLKVHLQLRGLTVFLDIEKLRAGKFDDNLLSSVRNARHFILVLTPNSLDRCVGDVDRKDWVHRVNTRRFVSSS